uniref:Uncharacterized protein n=1 Tax=viral metagenome TaxID=1070528 RepID=A0A6H1ZCB1_9ZZZZ
MIAKKDSKIVDVIDLPVTSTAPVSEKNYKPFLEITEPSVVVDPFEVKNWPGQYEKHWCLEKKVSHGRKGDWVVVDRTHPDFKGIEVPIDQSPDQTFIRYMDVILCCMRKETAIKKRDALNAKVKNKTEAVTNKYRAGVGKLAKATGAGGSRREAMQVMDTIEKEE